MKAYLMYPDRDFDPAAGLPWNAPDLIQDLALDTMFDAMAAGDTFVREVAVSAVLGGLHQVDAIGYRQDVLADCLRHPQVVRDLYTLAADAIAAEKKIFGGLWHTAGGILHRSVDVLDMFHAALTRLRHIADEHAGAFDSAGFSRFSAMIAEELSDAYLHTVAGHLRQLKFTGGPMLSARLGSGLRGVDYVLCTPRRAAPWWQRLTGVGPPEYLYRVADGDDSGARMLSELADRGLNAVANATAQAHDHILSFFRLLRAELAFYLGCLNLYERLSGKAEPTCRPEPLPAGQRLLRCTGLYDACLSLNKGGARVVGNDLHAEGKPLLVVTGANQGGKSTFLRSVGLAQLMMQAGMFVPATSFTATLASAVCTHFKREEDQAMESGKFDEELARVNSIVEHLHPGGLVLFNESFAATNEREGSQIGRQIIHALLESGVSVALVTHLFDLADSLHRCRAEEAVFLRPQRRDDGQRTFQLQVRPPQPTSFGADLYRRVFGTDPTDRRLSGPGPVGRARSEA